MVLALTLAACRREPVPIDVEIDLTTLRTGFVNGIPTPLVVEGSGEDRRLVQEKRGKVSLYVRVPEHAELRYRPKPGTPPTVAWASVREHGQTRMLNPRQIGTTEEWGAPLGVPGGEIVEIEITAALPTAWIRPRIIGTSTATPSVLDASLRPRAPLNVLLYVVDTLRASRLSVYGYARRTSPRLEELGRHALVFDNAYAAGSFTSPSVSAFMSSRFPSELHGWLSPDGAARQTLAETFKQAGYATAGFQANFLLTPELGYARGFDHYEVMTQDTAAGPGKVDAAALHAHALDWLRDHGDRPFFLYLQSMDVHFPYTPPAPYQEMFVTETSAGDMEKVRSLGKEVSQKVWDAFVENLAKMHPDRYDGAIAYADHEIGALLDELERRGLADRTIVIVTADHGEPLGDHDEWLHGTTVFEELVRVPLIMRFPGHPEGRRVADVVSLLDLAPTLAEVAHIPIPAQFVGRSLFAPGVGLRPATAAGELYHTVGATGWFARQGDWKMIMEGQTVRLFHLPSDPGETTNVGTQHVNESRWLATLATARPPLPEGAAAVRTIDEGLTEEQRKKRVESLRALGYVE